MFCDTNKVKIRLSFRDYVSVRINHVFPFIDNELRTFAKLLKKQSFALVCLTLQNKRFINHHISY